jgi:hypothetical protein
MLAIAVGAILLMAGCGGDDEGEDGGTTTPATNAGALTKEQYISRGDEICAQGTLRLGQQVQRDFGGVQPSGEEARQFAEDAVVPNLEQVLEELRALPAPAGDERKVAAIYDALQRGIDQVREDPDLFLEPNSGGAFDQANRLAQAYGFKQCGQA